jgi:tRNA pseudouridine38-40 synthase
MRNFKLLMSYDGSDFQGWQTQPGYRTVQETLETALGTLTGETKIRVNASGRTDAGVHALGQVANFFSAHRIPDWKLLGAINAHLPDDIVVRVFEEAPPTFDANRDALRKLYRYVIHDGPTPSPFLRKYACFSKQPLDAAAMACAARPLMGTHDFHSFETEWPNRASSIRTITHLRVNRAGEYVWIDVEADGFLYNMVRAIAGTLINIGRGYWPESKVAEILNAKDRTQAGPTAPAQGLFLVRVTYEISPLSPCTQGKRGRG